MINIHRLALKFKAFKSLKVGKHLLHFHTGIHVAYLPVILYGAIWLLYLLFAHWPDVSAFRGATVSCNFFLTVVMSANVQLAAAIQVFIHEHLVRKSKKKKGHSIGELFLENYL